MFWKRAPSVAAALAGATKCSTAISPVVIVPVLSSRTVSIFPAISSARGWAITIPRCAPRPEATRSATGVANPSAHGQAITITAIAVESE